MVFELGESFRLCLRHKKGGRWRSLKILVTNSHYWGKINQHYVLHKESILYWKPVGIHDKKVALVYMILVWFFFSCFHQIVLGALFHDIGHLLGIENHMKEMVTAGVFLGVHNHDIIGETFLKKLGFPPSVTDLVRYHVEAKRYLVCTDEQYYSRKTLFTLF